MEYETAIGAAILLAAAGMALMGWYRIQRTSDSQTKCAMPATELPMSKLAINDDDDEFVVWSEVMPATELPVSKLAIDDEFVVWSEVAKRLLPGDHFAFAMTSKVHRRAVKNHLGPKKPITTSLAYWQRNPENYQYTRDWLWWIVNTSTIYEGMRPPSLKHTKSAGIDGELCSDDEICSEEMPKSGRELYLGDVIYIAGFRGFLNAMLSLITQGAPVQVGVVGLVNGRQLICLKNLVVGYEHVAEEFEKRGLTGATAALLLGLASPRIMATAAAGGSLEICKYLVDQGATLDDETSAQAAKEGHVHILEWCLTQGCDMSRVALTAATNGQLAVLQWAVGTQDLLVTAEAPAQAAEFGHLECLQWMIEHGVQWIKKDCFDDATRGGHLHILQWLVSTQGCSPHEQSCYIAANHGRLQVIQWFFNDHQAIMDENTIDGAAIEGHLDIVQWCREQGCPWDWRACALAAQNGHVKVLKWLRANGCPWNARTCAYAAKGGKLKVLKWAYKHGCPLNELCCACAAQSGHLRILKWLRSNGCPWDSLTTEAAARSKRASNAACLKWALDNGCPRSERRPFSEVNV